MSAEHERRKSGADIAITLISRDPALTIRPRLYEGALDEMQVPLRPLLTKLGIGFELAEVKAVHPREARIDLDDGRTVTFDQAVLATGSHLREVPIPGAAQHGFSVDTFADAEALDMRLAELGDQADVVVIGAGFTGLELATELRGRLSQAARITLVDAQDNPAAEMGTQLEPVIAEALDQCQIQTKFGRRVKEITDDSVVLDTGERLVAGAVVLTVGLEANLPTHDIGAKTDPLGRILAEPDLRIAATPNIFAAGDTVHASTDGKNPALMTCQHALVLGRYAGVNALRDMLGQPTRPYRQEVYVTCLDLGPWGAAFTRGWNRAVELTGEDGKARKRFINRSLIYPPSPEDRAEDILASIALPEEEVVS